MSETIHIIVTVNDKSYGAYVPSDQAELVKLAPHIEVRPVQQLQEVDELIAKMELALVAEETPRPSISANIRALEKERRLLQQEFFRAVEARVRQQCAAEARALPLKHFQGWVVATTTDWICRVWDDKQAEANREAVAQALEPKEGTCSSSA